MSCELGILSKSVFKFKTLFILHFTLYIIHSTLAANPYQITPESIKVYQDITKLKLSPDFKPLSSSNAFQVYVENYADMVLLLVNDDPNSFKKYADREEKRLDILENFPKDSPYYKFYQAEIRLHWAFVKLKFGKELSGSWEIIRAYRLLEENAKLYPNFLPNYKSLGLLHILIGSTPESYRWVAKLLGLKGDIKKGLSELQTVIEKDKLYENEANLISILVHSYILKYTEKENTELLKLVAQNPDHLMFHFFGATVSMKDNRSEQALKILNSLPEGKEYLSFPFLEYIKAEIFLQKRQYTTAKILLNSFLSRYKGQNFVKDAYYKLLLCDWLTNDEVVAKKRAKTILEVGQTVVESDKAAIKFATKFLNNKISIQQKTLMRARLSFDGGYLEDAQTEIQSVNENTFIDRYDKAEYWYRSGRIFQKVGQLQNAIEAYNKATILSKDKGFYFGATSYLQLGFIYQSLRNKPLATQNFKNALAYPSHEYKNSVDNKAKAALSEMNIE